ncbi:MAG: hypothetical protein KGY70_19815 [Bacteroidales bacterium]|nr:hypothetical protein [Bacteroidales bacterium]
MDKEQLKQLIKQTLIEIGFYSESALNLLMGTAAQESHLGHYIEQINGPAKGIFQMEPNTFEDHINNYLNYKPDLKQRIEKTCDLKEWKADALVYNLKFAICMARVHYLRVPKPLPDRDAYHDLAEYWKAHYNTYRGRGTVEQFVNNYKEFVL